jgi:hypothetical protein
VGRLHIFTHPTPLNEVDVIYFKSSAWKAEARHQADLHARCSGVPWSIKNQARMHIANGDVPYLDTADAVRHWPETAAAIAARFAHGRIELLAPCGVDDFLNLIVRPTPPFLAKMEVYRSRQRQKRWTERWSKLIMDEGAGKACR